MFFVNTPFYVILKIGIYHFIFIGRRSLRRQKEKQILSSSSDNILSETNHNISDDPNKSCLQETPKTIIKISSI